MRALVLALALAAPGCGAPTIGILRVRGAPADALVTIDDHYVGKLGRLGRYGLKLPAGEHRVTVEANGYFPQDELVKVPANGDAKLDVKLEEIPD